MSKIKNKPWLDEKIAASRRAASRHDCSRCGRTIFTGDDDDRAALRVSIDPAPITQIEELVAKLRGYSTYDLLVRRREHVIYYRDVWHIGAGDTRGGIFLEHICRDAE